MLTSPPGVNYRRMKLPNPRATRSRTKPEEPKAKPNKQRRLKQRPLGARSPSIGGLWQSKPSVMVGRLFQLAAFFFSNCRRSYSHTTASHLIHRIDRKSTRLNSSHGYISY